MRTCDLFIFILCMYEGAGVPVPPADAIPSNKTSRPVFGRRTARKIGGDLDTSGSTTLGVPPVYIPTFATAIPLNAYSPLRVDSAVSVGDLGMVAITPAIDYDRVSNKQGAGIGGNQQTTNNHDGGISGSDNRLNLLGSFGPIQHSAGDEYDPNDSNCICPDTNGWSPEQMFHHTRRTNLTAGPFDCFCLGTKGYVLVQQKLGKKGEGNNPNMNCFCPKSSGWNSKQYTLLKKQDNFSGGYKDCFCSKPSDIPKSLGRELAASRMAPHEDEEDEDDGEQSHLSVVSLDGNLKEVRLGPLWVSLY